MNPSTIRFITTFGQVGEIPKAPGTFGALVALLFALAIDRGLGFWGLLVATIGITLLGFWSVNEALRERPGEDPSEIVIDEVAGMFVALLFPAFVFWLTGVGDWATRAYPAWIAAFALFRLFDIWKPSIIGKIDARRDAQAVMLDDLVAGAAAGVCTLVIATLWHLVF